MSIELSESQFSVQAVRTEPNGRESDGKLNIEFTMHGDLILKWQEQQQELPSVADKYAYNVPEGPYRWTAFHAHSYKRYIVLLVLIEPPYGSWWLGTADTLEQAEHMFHKWRTTDPPVTLGPSSSIGDYGV